MDVTRYEFKMFPWPPPDDRREPRFYLFGFDADGQPYVVKWRAGDHPCWLAASLDDAPEAWGAGPIVHAIIENNINKIAMWADAPLRWSVMSPDWPNGPPEETKD